MLLTPNFIEALLDAGQLDPRVGTVCGKLLTMTATFALPQELWWIPPASTSPRCCATWTAEARKWTTGTS